MIYFRKNYWWMLAVALFVSAGKSPAAAPAPQAVESGPGVTQEAGQTQSKLSLGDAALRGEQEIAIPLHLTAAPGVTVGRIRAEVLVPEGPWKFQRVEPPKDVGWKAAARERSAKEEGSDERQTWIELSMDAGSRAIPDGLIGHFEFALRGTGTQRPSGLTVRKLEVWPPEPEVVRNPDPLAPPSELPGQNPQVGCFFFTH